VALARRCSLCLKVLFLVRLICTKLPHYVTADSLFFYACRILENFKEETGRIETSLDPINSPVKDTAAMNVLRLESRLASVLDYIARLKVALSKIDKALWP
jgi:hypothetical protein